MMKEIHKGPTPSGGVSSEIYYFDSDMNPVDKKLASFAVIRELDKDGNLIQETRANLK
ncbi:hypothetical protein SRRS_07110 [Sporomusa rhizae]|uniref:hypothetical protein n=1 Tax=Sporomusa rhizae TaxID=357999 RepID=UPI00352B03A6